MDIFANVIKLPVFVATLVIFTLKSGASNHPLFFCKRVGSVYVFGTVLAVEWLLCCAHHCF